MCFVRIRCLGRYLLCIFATIAGLNWFALPGLVVKADYTTRQIGTGRPFGKSRYKSENEFAIGVVYVSWFLKR